MPRMGLTYMKPAAAKRPFKSTASSVIKSSSSSLSSEDDPNVNHLRADGVIFPARAIVVDWPGPPRGHESLIDASARARNTHGA